MITPNVLSKKGPLFKDKLYITRPTLPSLEELTPFMQEMLEKRWVTNFGDFHNQLEARLKEILGVKYVLLCCNGTVALFLLIKALKLKGKVITTPFTFPATVHAITMANLEPLLCDIDPDSYTLDPARVKEAMSSEVSSILAVNVFSNMCDVEALKNIADTAMVPVIYDSAHAFLNSYQGKRVGGFGKAEMFSFHATKLFTTLEGGLITTNDKELYNDLKNLRNFGIKDEERVTGVGLNAKMSEMNAIFGLLNLKKMPEVIKKLSFLHAEYRQRLSEIPGVKFQKIREGCIPNHQYFTIEIISKEFGMDRDKLHNILKKDNVITRKYFYPLVNHYECYKDIELTQNRQLPHAEKVSERILCLPLYYSLRHEDVINICELIKGIHYHTKDISNIVESLKSCVTV